MNKLLSQYWWTLALRGVITILFGVLALMWPDLTLLVLVFFFAAFALITGAVSVIGALRNRENDDDWGLLLLLGLVGIGTGLVALMHPDLGALVLVLVMGANALMTGILDIAIALRLRKTIHHESILVLSGLISVVFGVYVFLFPDAGALALVWLISFYAIVTGVLLLGLAGRLRAKTKTMHIDRRYAPDRRRESVGHT